MTLGGPGMDQNELPWTWVGPRLTWVAPGLTLVRPGLTRVRPGLTWVEPGKTREKPGKNLGKTWVGPGIGLRDPLLTSLTRFYLACPAFNQPAQHQPDPFLTSLGAPLLSSGGADY